MKMIRIIIWLFPFIILAKEEKDYAFVGELIDRRE